MNEFLAFFTTAPFKFPCTRLALNEQKMTTAIDAVYMGIGGLPALVATGDDFLSYPLSQPLIKHKILATEFILEALFLHGVSIMNNAAL